MKPNKNKLKSNDIKDQDNYGARHRKLNTSIVKDPMKYNLLTDTPEKWRMRNNVIVPQEYIDMQPKSADQTVMLYLFGGMLNLVGGVLLGYVIWGTP